MADIKELKEVVVFIIEGYLAGRKMLEDDKIGLTDLAHALPLIPSLIAAVEGIKEIPEEVKDLSAAEATELITFVANAFGITQERAVPKLQKSFDIARALKSLGE